MALGVVSLWVVLFVSKEQQIGDKKETFQFSLIGRQKFRKGMDVAGWVKLTYKVDFSKYEQYYQNTTERELAKKRTVSIILNNIEKRVSSLGVSDYNARQQIINNEHFLVVEIGGIYSLEQAKETIGKTVELEFKVESTLSKDQSTLIARNAAIASKLFADIKKNPSTIAQIVSTYSSEDLSASALSGEDVDVLATNYPFYANNRDKIIKSQKGDMIDLWLVDIISTSPSQKDSIRGYVLLAIDSIDVNKNTPLSGALALSGQKNETIRISGKQFIVPEKQARITAVDPSTQQILNGAYFSYATVGRSNVGTPSVNITFDDKGKTLFCNLTKAYVGQRMAIFVGGGLVTAPNINEAICGGSAQITGQPDMNSAKELAKSLNEWSLPAPLTLSQEEKVSPALWEWAMQWALIAAWVALVLILLMLLVLYPRQRALLWFFVLINYAIHLLALFKLSGYAFSLWGIAAIILSLGMGIDANILIFERLNEELKAKKSRLSAVESACERSRMAILDGNMTTILIFVILFMMGMSIVKWFGYAGMITWFLILIIIVPLTKLLLKKIVYKQ